MMKTWLVGFAVALAPFVSPGDARADVDLRAQAGRMLSAMEGDAHRVSLLLRSARNARAPGPIQCVNRYLSQIDAGVRHGRDDVADIRAAIAVGDTRTAFRAMGWLSSRREAARTASFAADSCVGPSTEQPDSTVVHVVVDPKLPSDRSVFAR